VAGFRVRSDEEVLMSEDDSKSCRDGQTFNRNLSWPSRFALVSGQNVDVRPAEGLAADRHIGNNKRCPSRHH
jgi:hypothetical protein